jgi:hypothetical protein
MEDKEFLIKKSRNTRISNQTNSSNSIRAKQKARRIRGNRIFYITHDNSKCKMQYVKI